MMTAANRGVALILVILVLSALLIIGTPFVVSMKIQEQGSIHTLANERANLAALSARNHALAKLMAGYPTREKGTIQAGGTGAKDSARGSAGAIVAPQSKVDDYGEVDVSIESLLHTLPDEGSGKADDDIPLRSWDGRILDVQVEDEQGKININSATATMLGNLLAGSQLSGDVTDNSNETEIPVEDTSVFPADTDPDTVDGVVVILNPMLLTMEAVSYRGKTATHLTGCFRGEYLSIPQPHSKGSPVFDLRGMKVYLNRYHYLDDEGPREYRTPQAIREISEWSIVPTFLQNLAVIGLNVRNMEDFGLTPQMLLRAGLDEALLKRHEEDVDPKDYEKARRKLLKADIPREAVDLLVKFRGKAAVIQAADVVDKMHIGQKEIYAFKGVFESRLKAELKRIQTNTRTYFPKAIEAYKQIYDRPGMETLTARDYDRIRDLITTSSTIPAKWSEEQMIIGEINTNPIIGFPSFRVPHSDWFNAGTLVRIRSLKDPKKVEYQIAVGAFPGGGRGRGRGGVNLFQGGVILKAPLRYTYEDREAVVSALLRHPININTAPRKVLEAVLASLSTDPRGRILVTTEEAKKLVDLLMKNMPIVGFAHFRTIVEQAAQQKIIRSEVVRPILLNAVNPNDWHLRISSTSFCYATGNVYTIDSSGVINNPAGLELASHRMREIIDVAPADPLHLTLDSQDDWDSRIFWNAAPERRQWSRFSTFRPGRESNLMVTTPVPLNRKPWEAPSMTDGALKGLTAELTENTRNYGFGPITWGSVEHFPETIEGENLAEGPYTMKTTLNASAGGLQGSGGSSGAASSSSSTAQTQVRDLITEPGVVEFWVRPNWETRASDRTFFDTVADPQHPQKNRLQLFFQAATQSIVFRVSDDTELPAGLPGSGIPTGTVSAAEVRYKVNPQTFANDTWYHVAAAWGSTQPGDQALFIDGRPVGQTRWMSRLAAPLPYLGYSVTLEDPDIAADFPAFGSLLIGTEVVDYVRKDGANFQIRRAGTDPTLPGDGRGARGTVRQEHPRGAPVRLYGYSLEIAPSDPGLTTIVDPTRGPVPTTLGNTILVGKGGAKLSQPLAISRAMTFQGLQVSAFATVRGVNGQLQPTDTTIKVQDDPLAMGFPHSGYLQVRYWVQHGVLLVLTNTEYVKYGSIQMGGGAAGQPTYQFVNVGRGMLGSTAANPSSFQGASRYDVVSVSIETDVNDLDQRYPSSGIIQIDRGAPATTGGPGTPGAATLPDVEWIRYTQIAEKHYFIADSTNHIYQFRGYTGNVRFIPNDRRASGYAIFDQTSISNHPKGQEIFPVIRVNRPYVGVGDYTSVADTYGDPTQRKFEPVPLRVRKVQRTDNGTFVSFWKQAVNTYLVAGNPKLKKFPSGELPSASTGQLVFGGPAAPGVDGGPLDATIDEIRLSQSATNDVDITAFPLPGGSSLRLDEVPHPPQEPRNIQRRVIRPWFRDQDEVKSGGALDKILLLGQSRLEVAQTKDGNFFRQFTAGNPRSFGLGKPEGVFLQDGEAFHYTFQSGDVDPPVIVQMLQDLPRDWLALDDDQSLPQGSNRTINPWRDLRSELIPKIDIKVLQGTLPGHDGFLEMITDERKEVIYYSRTDGTHLYDCLRGQLGTEVGGYIYQVQRPNIEGGWNTVTYDLRMRLLPRREVDLRTRRMLDSESQKVGVLTPKSLLTLPEINVTRLSGTITNDAIPVLSTDGFSPELGYLRMDDGNVNTTDEIIGYVQTNGQNQFLRARDERSGQGIFRGRFGTEIREGLPSDTPLVELPVRYHDRYQAEVESPDLMYLERSCRMPGARWDSIHWEVEKERNRTFKNEVRVLVRFDGAPDWDSKPTNRPGGLYLFSDGEATNTIGVDANLVELRVMFRYLPGSYGRNAGSLGGWNDDWKNSPVVKSLTLDYRKAWRVLHREDLSY